MPADTPAAKHTAVHASRLYKALGRAAPAASGAGDQGEQAHNSGWGPHTLLRAGCVSLLTRRQSCSCWHMARAADTLVYSFRLDPNSLSKGWLRSKKKT